MKFRFHCGSLAESLDTTVEVNSYSELLRVIADSLPVSLFCYMPAFEIEFSSDPIFDSRCGWDTYLISIRFDNDPRFKCCKFVIGMSDGNTFAAKPTPPLCISPENCCESTLKEIVKKINELINVVNKNVI